MCAGGELPPSAGLPRAGGSSTRSSGAGGPGGGSSSIHTSISERTSEPLAHYASMEGGEVLCALPSFPTPPKPHSPATPNHKFAAVHTERMPEPCAWGSLLSIYLPD